MPTVGANNDFGLGLIGASSGNVIEHTACPGTRTASDYGAKHAATQSANNIVAGNPPSQLSRSYGPIGFDIKDEAVANGARNTFEGNWCITYAGPGPAPCPGLLAVVPPTISALTATPNVLWPANRKLIAVSIAVKVLDDGDPAPVCEVTDVSANEPLEVRIRA